MNASDIRIVFCDVDGTLLNSRNKVLPGTVYAVRRLEEKGIPFVITSGRCAKGIFPIMDDHNMKCHVIAFNGAVILDSEREVLYATGLTRKETSDVIALMEKELPECVWNIFSGNYWYVRDCTDPRVLKEAKLLRTVPENGSVETLPEEETIGKILCISREADLRRVENVLQTAFPDLTVYPSMNYLLEIVPQGLTKRTAVRKLCEILDIPLECAAAFGDHFNDAEMLGTVGHPFLMGNAPDGMKAKFPNVIRSNDDEGIYHCLVEEGIIEAAELF